MGKYRLIREIGRGGMGVVYLAEDTQLGREVALKVLNLFVGNDPTFVEKFRAEARTVASLSHPNVIHINAFDTIDGEFVIDMPYMAGGSFREELNAGVSAGRLVRVLWETLSALESCHEAGVVHRDIKPSNLLVAADRSVQLADFGISKLMAEQWEAATADHPTTTVVGTPEYLAPEILQGEPASVASDLFAVGLMGREGLLGALPFHAKSPYAMIRAIVEKDVDDATPERAGASVELTALVNTLLAKQPEKRPSTAQEARALLEETEEFGKMGGEDAPTQKVTPIASRASRQRLQKPSGDRAYRRWTLAAGFVALLALLGILMALMSDGSRSDTLVSPAEAAASQETTFATALPDAETLLTLNKWDTDTRVYSADVGSQEASLSYAVFYGDNSAAAAEAMLAGPGRVACLRFAEREGKTMGEGYWARGGEAGRFRWGGVEAELTQVEPGRGAIRMDLQFTSESDWTEWSEVVTAAVLQTTDTAAIATLESDGALPTSLLLELLPRLNAAPVAPEAAWARDTITRMFPSLIDSYYAVPVSDLPPDATIEVLENLVWATAFPARPFSNDHAMSLALDPNRLYFRFTSPDRAGLRIRIALWNTSRPADEPLVASFEINAAGELNLPLDWEGNTTIENNALTATLSTPLLTAADHPPGSGFRVNAQVEAEQRAGDWQPVAVWGWPQLTEVAHGMIVHVVPDDA